MKTFEFDEGPPPFEADPQVKETLAQESDDNLKESALVRYDKQYTHYCSDNGSPDLTLCTQQRKGPHSMDPLAVTCPRCWNLLSERRLVPASPDMVQVARPTLDKKISSAIIVSVCNGTAPETAAALNGISKRQLMDWVMVGSRLLDSDAVYFTPEEALLIEFTLGLRRAVAEHEVNLTQAIISAGQIPEQWRANTWMLENYHPDRFGKSVKISMDSNNSDANSGPGIDYSKLSDAELIKLDQMMRKATGNLIDVTPTEDSQEHSPREAED